jgi:hypothetical protein
MKKLIPEEGANLVGVDPHGMPGEELYLVAHYDTKEEAIRARDERLRDDSSEILHVYAAN